MVSSNVQDYIQPLFVNGMRGRVLRVPAAKNGQRGFIHVDGGKRQARVFFVRRGLVFRRFRGGKRHAHMLFLRHRAQGCGGGVFKIFGGVVFLVGHLLLQQLGAKAALIIFRQRWPFGFITLVHERETESEVSVTEDGVVFDPA